MYLHAQHQAGGEAGPGPDGRAGEVRRHRQQGDHPHQGAPGQRPQLDGQECSDGPGSLWDGWGCRTLHVFF